LPDSGSRKHDIGWKNEIHPPLGRQGEISSSAALALFLLWRHRKFRGIVEAVMHTFGGNSASAIFLDAS
jgi:hypothetical protein